MGIKTQLSRALDSLLRPFGYRVLKEEFLYDWQKTSRKKTNFQESQLPTEARSYLTQSNPRLTELRKRYAACDSAVTTPFVWTDDLISTKEMQFFRGEVYVWQLLGSNMNVFSYALTTYYVKSIDRLGLLGKLTEDNLFGVHTFTIDQKLISRDLLDSIMEISFIDRHLHVSTAERFNILDIGAGYGRLAHRALSALPNIEQYLCTDAFPVSSFISEFYLRYRKVDDRGIMVPLDKIEQVLQDKSIDLAVNIHSFSECQIPAIEWWVSRLAAQGVTYLMIVPNAPELYTNDGNDFGKVIEKNGYRLKVKEPKYSDPVVQQYGLNPTYYYLFELQ